MSLGTSLYKYFPINQLSYLSAPRHFKSGLLVALAVTLRTAMFKIQKILPADYTAFMCFVRISEQTAIFALYCIN